MSAAAAAPDLEPPGAQEVLEHMVREFHPRLAVACSFQKEASVILDMLVGIEPSARFFVLDTGVLFEETYATWRRVEERYGITIERYAGEHVAEREVRYDPLHDRGFASIGCTPCTAPGAGRDGRWAGTDRIECGLHLPAGVT